MRALDGRITPGGDPEPSEAEFFADMDRIDKIINSASDDAEEAMRKAKKLEDFVQKHRRRLARLKMPTDEFLATAAQLRAQCNEALQKAEKATEKLLQAQANVAEMTPQAVELIFQIALEVHGKWDGLPPDDRANWQFIIDCYRDNRDQWLGELPIEDRRRLEAKYPKWW